MYVEREKDYPSCTTPWHQHLIGIKNYNNQDLKSCNQAQLQRQVQLDTKFIKQAAAYRSEYCPGNRTTIKYRLWEDTPYILVEVLLPRNIYYIFVFLLKNKLLPPAKPMLVGSSILQWLHIFQIHVNSLGMRHKRYRTTSSPQLQSFRTTMRPITCQMKTKLRGTRKKK